MDFNASDKDLWQAIYNSGDLHYCFNCSTCISICPASYADPPLLVRNLARMVVYGLEDELLDEDTPWTCVSCSRCDETRVPTAIVEIYKRGYTQSVGTNTKLRESLGLPELQTITKMPEQLKLFQEMLMKTPVISENDYMFKEE